jgi:predicted  nucleic acid-binding Zn-ribbon protein
MANDITYETKIKRLDTAIKAARDDRAKALANKEMLEKEISNLRQEAEALGVNPDELGQKIIELREQMDKLIEEAKSLLPAEYLDKVGF